MTWTTPLTATANAALTAAQWNASVRDNLNETAAAKATTAGSIFVSTGANQLAERFITDNIIDTSETTTSTSYADLSTFGPYIDATTGVKALIWINARMSNSGSNLSHASLGVSSSTTIAPSDSRGLTNDGSGSNRHGCCILLAVTPGTNRFYMQYKVGAGTGTFLNRRMQVMAL